MSDDNPRPHKRQRTQSSGELATPESLRPLPPAILLVSLPALLVHPPNHRLYPHSLFLSLASLRKCLALPALSPEIECRAWTGLAEIGMKVIGGGLSQSEEHPWAKDIEAEVGKALSKGSIIAQKHPSLRAYRHHLVLLQAQLSHWQHKTKFARTQIRNLIASFWPTDPPHIVYSAHLAAISLLTTPNSPPTSSLSKPMHASPSPPHSRQDIHAALAAVEELERLSITNGHTRVTLFIHVLRLRILVAANMWADVPDALQRSETSLGLSYTPASTPKPRKDPRTDVSTPPEATFVAFEDPLEAAMVVHLLIMAVVFYTHVGSAADVSPV
ncbi:hypothetical protein A0H81_14826 [Grifola frondosa]|uniref:Uncharacterized protein n=1 Tax=Grifola frondosa TaxID=5627 RepID=A0A1C7LKU1_GRIFR|nr:hypothetical protein A0H81_14826 [Grifola frondosa]